MNATTIRGVVPIIPVPFRPDESVDEEGVAACCTFAAERGAAASVPPRLRERVLQAIHRGAGGGGAYRRESRGRAGAGHRPVESRLGAPRRGAGPRQRAGRRGRRLGRPPRNFGYTEADLLDFARTVGQAVGVPLLIQDWNPTGPTVGGEFCARLREACPNFRYIKLGGARDGTEESARSGPPAARPSASSRGGVARSCSS